MADLDAVDVAHGIEAAALTAVTRAAASRNAYVPFTSRQVIAGAVLDAVRDLLIQEGRRQAEAGRGAEPRRRDDQCSRIARDVAEFHVHIGSPPWSGTLADMPERQVLTRNRLVAEEVSELIAATAAGDLVGIADGLADVVYVAYGTAYTYGVDLGAVLAEVHRSNMTKDPGATGKAVKGERYTPPDIRAVLDSARAARDEAQAMLRLAPHHQQQVETLKYELVQARAEVMWLTKQRDAALARANEAARLSAEARDQADDLRRLIADLREQVAIIDESRTDMTVVQLRLEDECAGYRAERDEARHERDLWQAEHATARDVIAAVKVQRDAMRPVVEALADLVGLKDGPRGPDYEQRKPLAWQTARDRLAAVDQMAQPVVAAPLISADPANIPHITVKSFPQRYPVARGTCETCGKALIYNLAVSPELLEHVAADSTCENPWPTVHRG